VKTLWLVTIPRIVLDCKPCSRVCSGTAGPDYGRHYLVPNTSQSAAGTVGDGYRGYPLRGDAASRLRKILCRYVCEHLLEVEPLGEPNVQCIVGFIFIGRYARFNFGGSAGR
jgi:hypothetical protein